MAERTENNAREVRIRLSFKRILNVSIVEQSFTAEIFFEASWEESEFAGMPEVKVDNSVCSSFPATKIYLEADKDKKLEDRKAYDTPHLHIGNIKDKKSEIDVENWFEIYYNYGEPIVCQRVKLTASFQERMELEHFPFDEQELGIDIISYCPYTSSQRRSVDDEYGGKRFVLVRNLNMKYKSLVVKSNFVQENEYELMDIIRFTQGITDPNDSASKKTYSTLKVACLARRLKPFWIYNVVLPLFLLTALCAGAFSVPVNDISSRAGITLAIILSTVAFKFLISDKLPSISYLTIIDVYVLVCLVVQTGITLESIIWAAAIYDRSELITTTEHYEFGSPAYLVTWYLVLWTMSHVLVFFGVYIYRQRTIDNDFRDPINDRYVWFQHGKDAQHEALIKEAMAPNEVFSDQDKQEIKNNLRKKLIALRDLVEKNQTLQPQSTKSKKENTLGPIISRTISRALPRANSRIFKGIEKKQFHLEPWTRDTANEFIGDEFENVMMTMKHRHDTVKDLEDLKKNLKDRGEMPFMRCEKERDRTKRFYVLSFKKKEDAVNFVSDIKDIKEAIEEIAERNEQFRKELEKDFDSMIKFREVKDMNNVKDGTPFSCLSCNTGGNRSKWSVDVCMAAEMLLPEWRVLSKASGSRVLSQKIPPSPRSREETGTRTFTSHQ